MRMLKIRIFFENFSKSPKVPFSFLIFLKTEWLLISQFSALRDFSKLVVFFLKLGFLRRSTLYPIFFSKTGVFFYATFFF